MLSFYKKLAALVQLIFLFSLSHGAFAAQPVIKVAVPENYPPFYFKDTDGTFKGVSYEVATHVFNKLGYQIEIKQLSSMRTLLSALKDGRQHVSINLTATDERSELAYFTQTPHVYESQHLITRADSQIRFTGDLQTLTDYRFGPIFGWTYGPKFDRSTNLDKEFVNNSVQQLKGLLSGRYDIALNNPQFFSVTATSLGIASAFRLLEPAVYTLPVTMAVSKSYPEAEALVAAMEKEIALFVKSDSYKQILERYGFAAEATP
jgi:ABC-type amino acid transport substrate-binding protein